jgi:Ala-tRNA(Pro) deacylase
MSTLTPPPTYFDHYLTDHGIPHEVIPHPRDYMAQATAADTHTPGRAFAKCVLVWIDNYYAMVVLPADHRVDFSLLLRETGAVQAGLVREEEMLNLFPDCELGAEPPFGKLYDLPVFVAAQIADQPSITFNAGSHDVAIRMSYFEFACLVEPTVLDCARKVDAANWPAE